MDDKTIQSLIAPVFSGDLRGKASTDTTGIKTINVQMIAVNRNIGSHDGGVTKQHVNGLILFDDNTMFGPIEIAAAVDVGHSAQQAVVVPSKTPTGATFYWYEEHGGTIIRRLARMDRDSQYIGQPWDAALIAWYGAYVDAEVFEYYVGGIAT